MKIVDYHRDHPVKHWIKEQLNRAPSVYERVLQIKHARRDRQVAPQIRGHIDRLRSHKTLPLFSEIQFETLNRCNGGCSFCPVNRFDDPREQALMSEDLYHKIIDNLAALNYGSTVYFHGNNEPLLDKRIYGFIEYARKQLPKARLAMFTNGTALTVDRFKTLVTHLDNLVIDNYNDDLVLNTSTKKVVDFCDANPEWGEKARVSIRKETEKLDKRGSNAKNRATIKTLESSCLRPFTQINVRPDGKISLCCNDSLGDVTLGNLQTQSLLEIWYGADFDDVRQKMLKGRAHIDLCKECDTMFCPDSDRKWVVNAAAESYAAGTLELKPETA